jgi:hypothetical protein
MATKCPTCGRLPTRSLPQNARLHKLFTEIAANVKAKDGLMHEPMWWKVMSKHQWLGYDEYLMPDGKTIYQLKSTASLDVEALTEFMNEVERYAASKGVWLQE